MRRLTEKQQQCLKTVARLIEQNGYAPTLNELSQALGGIPISTLYQRLDSLRKRGLVEWRTNGRRSLRVTEAGWQAIS
jgi:SOS-response transcriptional repressors (RecA-mediated autopeptidases)